MTEPKTAHPIWDNQYLVDLIAFFDAKTYKSMLAVPAFARRCRGEQSQSRIQSSFIVEVKRCGGFEYYLCGKLHNVYDMPASAHTNGSRSWYKYGKLHRDDGPAVIYNEGSREWYREGKLHRDDGPAKIRFHQYRDINWDGSPYVSRSEIIYIYVDREWYREGKLHRDDMPAVIHANGYRSWYQNGEQYRNNGMPVVVYVKGKQYKYQDGMLQRGYCLPVKVRANKDNLVYLSNKDHWIRIETA